MNLKKLEILSSKLTKWLFNITRFFKGYNILSPLYVELLLTYRCNFNCDFCYQADKRRLFPDMSLEDAAAIENNIVKSFGFKPRIHLFGGEPTVNDNFGAILQYFSDEAYRISMTTNGENVDKYMDILIRATGLKEVVLSLNTMNFQKYISLLDRFNKMKKKRSIRIILNCPINRTNQYKLVDIIKEFENSYASCITFQHTTFTDNYKAMMDFHQIKEQVVEIRNNRYNIPVFFRPDIKVGNIIDYYSNPLFPSVKNKCVFSLFVLFVQPNGDVIPCDEMNIVMGNAKKDRLKEVWNSAKFANFRGTLQEKSPSYPICKRCCHRCYY